MLDWVPNHMGIRSGHNLWWDDVLENGPSSEFAQFFDVAWAPSREHPAGRVLLPILADQYGDVLERGDLSIVWHGGFLKLAYFDRLLPLAPKSLIPLLESVLQKSQLGSQEQARE